MRLFVAAVALSICLWPFSGALSLAASASDTAAPATPPAPAPADAGGANADAAAARHAKRTACLEQAKTRKLIGAKKSAFLKNCITNP